eukprot:3386998-Pyramimonas_sp.AAC.1
MAANAPAVHLWRSALGTHMLRLLYRGGREGPQQANRLRRPRNRGANKQVPPSLAAAAVPQ